MFVQYKARKNIRGKTWPLQTLKKASAPMKFPGQVLVLHVSPCNKYNIHVIKEDIAHNILSALFILKWQHFAAANRILLEKNKSEFLIIFREF